MISAVDALLLPSARLNIDQIKAVEKLMAQVDEMVRTSMGRMGVDLQTTLSDPNCIAEANLRFKDLGYVSQWTQLIKPHRFNAALQECVGFRLQLHPSDEAYKEAAKTLDTMAPVEAPASSLLSLS